MNEKEKKKSLTSFKIFRGYLIIILIGTILLSLPFATKDGVASYGNTFGSVCLRIFNSLFTATSSTCVTGLIVVPTGNTWTLFGQIVILIMIQTGGLGFMVIIYLLAVIIRRKITLHERKSLMQAQGSFGVNGIIQLLKKIILFAAIFEFIGTLILVKPMIDNFGVSQGIWYAIFVSVSAFCNAGFDPFLLSQSSSLSAFAANPLVILTIAGLIICGGLGFIVWDDLFKNKFRFKRLNLHSKIVLTTSGILLLLPAILFFIFEYNHAYQDMNLWQKILSAFFQSTTCRTAGFESVAQGSLSNASSMLSGVLMFIGGSSGSTAGGVKTTTIAVLFLSILSTTLKKSSIRVGKRQLEANVTRNASAILAFYIFLVITSSLAIMGLNPSIPYRDVLFEAISAIGTVGLTAAGTASFSIVSQGILIVLMFVGRLGALSIIALFREKSEMGSDIIKLPTEQILIG